MALFQNELIKSAEENVLMELLDIYDENRVRTGRIIARGHPLAQGEFHIVVVVCVFNSKGEMLIQQRQSFKKGWPNKWDATVGGCAVAGETSRMAAERELFEEVGIKWDFSGLRPYFTMNFDYCFSDFYIIEEDVDIAELELQYEEVQAARWAARDEVLQMIEDDEFLPCYKSLLSLLFSMKGRPIGGLSV